MPGALLRGSLPFRGLVRLFRMLLDRKGDHETRRSFVVQASIPVHRPKMTILLALR